METTVLASPIKRTDEEKHRLRRELSLRRASISPPKKCVLENRIAKKLLTLPQYRQAPLVLTYLSTSQEISTAILVAHALGLGKRVAVPRCRPGGNMDFCLFDDYKKLIPGTKGILEPPPQAPVLRDFRGAICIVPALAADRSGYRLGYGGGYYDRFLAEFPGASVAVVFDFALLDRLPVEPYDQPVSLVLTDRQIVQP